MRQQIMFDVPAGLSIDEIKQVFRCLADDPQQRLPARHLRFFNPRHADDATPSRSRASGSTRAPPRVATRPPQFVARASSRSSSTFATNAAEFVGELIPLDKPRR